MIYYESRAVGELTQNFSETGFGILLAEIPQNGNCTPYPRKLMPDELGSHGGYHRLPTEWLPEGAD